MSEIWIGEIKLLRKVALTTKLVFGSAFFVFIIAAVLIKAMYRYNDFPYFTSNTLLDYSILAMGIAVIIFMIQFKSFFNKVLDPRVVSLLFLICGVIFIYMVPLKPFSDMQQVYNAALEFSNFDFHRVASNIYFNQYPNNLLISMIYGFLLAVTCKSLVAVKLLNLRERQTGR